MCICASVIQWGRLDVMWSCLWLARYSEAQKRDALAGCAILNEMLEIGRPVPYQFRQIGFR